VAAPGSDLIFGFQARRTDQFHYTYDREDRFSTFDGPANFANDQRDQLIGMDRAGATRDETYGYDAAGYRIDDRRAGAAASTLVYGEKYKQNRLQSDGVYAYTYDKEGNTATKERLGANPALRSSQPPEQPAPGAASRRRRQRLGCATNSSLEK